MNDPGIKWGVIGGVASIVLTVILYVIDPPLIFSSISWLGTIINVGVMYMAGSRQKQLQQGFITWSEALKPTFQAYVISTAFYFIYDYVLFTYIDPSLLEVQKVSLIKGMQSYQPIFGEDYVEQYIEQLSKMEQITIGDQIFDWSFNLIKGFFIGAILASILRRVKPQF